MIGGFVVDRPTLIWLCLTLPLFLRAVLDTERFLWLLSYGRKKKFSRFELMVLRVPGTIVVASCAIGIAFGLLQRA